MAGAAGGALASAVSSAGGLGLVGVGHGATAQYIDRELSLVGSQDKAWGAGLMSWSLDLDDAALRAVLEHRPRVVALAAGDPTVHARTAHDAGAFVVVQVGTSQEVREAHKDPHIGAIVVRGCEAGGHGLNEVATLPLLGAARQITDKPVIAAGGIATVHGVAAVLAAGAAGAWVGTRFIPSAESLATPAHKDAVLAATTDDTVYTSVFDIALQVPWPHEYGGRALVNGVTDRYSGHEEQRLRDDVRRGRPNALDLTERVRAAKAQGDPSAQPMYAGQSAGLVGRQLRAAPSGGTEPSAETGLVTPDTPYPSAAEVVAELGGFRQVLADAARRWPA
jgi:nitronate monooxygenase